MTPTGANPLAGRIHDRVLQQLGVAMMKAELCERLTELGRQDELAPRLAELRVALDQAVLEMRVIMTELRKLPHTIPEGSLTDSAA